LTGRACSLAVLAALALPAAAVASSTQESTFSDDDLLVRGSPAVQASTLDTMKALGADRVRVSLVWRLVAPAAADAQKPAGFDATNPNAYPSGAWDRYDRLVALAKQRGLNVAFDVTAPAPNWATGTPPEQPEIDPTFDPNATEFSAFVHAAAVRYRSVRYWSIWNEPNDATSLTPQWLHDPRDPTRWVPTAPQVYRRLVDAAWQALQETGHGRDTILIGETAPKGLLDNAGLTASIDAQLFVRELYCVDANLQTYQGTSADVRGCPADGNPSSFAAQHPGLFAATGWAHHPYELSIAPNEPPRHADTWLTLGNLGDLTSLLRRIRARFGQPAQALSRLYLTEYGYQTDPPEKQGVSPKLQAEYLNHAEYLTWRNPAVRTLGQFPLRDGTPVATTFQSGLRTAKGVRKPAFDAYALPVWLPSARVTAGSKLKVWGLARAAPNGKRAKVSIQVRRRGSRTWARVATRSTSGPRGYLTANVTVRDSGDLRLVWNGHHSRAASFTVR
jgi:Cellulase (glycosyl hydrolase family 5)